GVTIATGPTVTSSTPSAGSNSGSVTVTITGTGFVSGAGLSASLQRTGQPDIVGTSIQFVSATSMKATFDLTLAAPGAWDISVTNPDHGTGVRAGCFTVAASAPTVTLATPGTLGRGASDIDVDLTGTNFANGATVTISGTDV